jgi:hypothetical protein
MTEEQKAQKPLLSITGAKKNDNGDIELEFDLSDEFVEIFKKEHNLKKWSQKRFDEWASQNIEALLAVAGLDSQKQEEE